MNMKKRIEDDHLDIQTEEIKFNAFSFPYLLLEGGVQLPVRRAAPGRGGFR